MNGQPFHMIFSPQNSTLEVLNATLTRERRALADTLIKSVKQGLRRKSSNHHLLIGPRGSGKTHILAFVRKTIEQNPTDFPSVKVLALSEEERGLTTLLDFLLACLRAGDIDTTPFLKEVAGLPRTEVEQVAVQHIEQLSNNRFVLVFLENLSALFSALGGDESDRLRGFLQTHPNFSLLASSTELFQDSSRPDHPFYGFFNITVLRALKQKETGAYLANLAESRGDHELAAELRQPKAQPRLRAIYDLTGGNHRLLAMLGNFLTKDGLADLVAPFVQTVDRELTPYYQQRLDRLSPQQNKILRTIADQHGRALPVKEIAALIFSDSQTVSRQLHDLLHCGLVRRKPRGRESYYELNEPLMRLVLDIKEGRGQPLPLIVSFLTGWHTIDDLQKLAKNASPEAALYYKQAYAEVGSQLAAELFGKGLKYGELDQPEDEIESYDEIVRRFGGSDQPELQKHVAIVLVNKGIALGKLGRTEDEIKSYTEIVNRFGSSDYSELWEPVAKALVNKGISLGNLERARDAILTYDEVITRFGERVSLELQKQVSMALINKGAAFGKLGRTDEAIAIYDEVLRRYDAVDCVALQDAVSKALINKGIELSATGRNNESIVIFDQIIERFKENQHPELQKQVAGAMVERGVAFGKLGGGEKTAAIFDEVIEQFESSRVPDIIESVAMAFYNKGILFRKLGSVEKEIAAYDALVKRYEKNEASVIQLYVAQSLVNKSVALGKQGERLRAIAICKGIVDRYMGSKSKELKEAIARAQLNKVLLLMDSARFDEGFDFLESIIDKFPEERPVLPLLVETVLSSFVEKPEFLERLTAIFFDRSQHLSEGLIMWIRGMIPLNTYKAKELQKAETNLIAAWGSIPDCDLSLKALQAVRRDAMGDNKALLQLPLEIRNLVSPDDIKK